MKIALITTILFIMTLSAEAFVIVSDFDDTIKQSHIGDKSETVSHALFRTWKPFAGMSELFQAWANNANGDCSNIYVISASPFFLKNKIRSFAKRINLPSKATLIMNKKIRSSTQEYKLNELEKLLRKNPTERFILIGDDTEYDPEIYFEFRKRHPENVEATYIRWVKGRKGLAENQNYFFTAHDIANLEEFAGRITRASEVEDAVLNAETELSFPSYLKHSLKKNSRPYSLIKSEKIRLWYQTMFDLPLSQTMMSAHSFSKNSCIRNALPFI